MKVLILGHGQHGKETTAKLINKHFGLSHISSSLMALDKVIYPVLQPKYGYKDKQECFDDRHSKRLEWRGHISEYNTPDKGRLCKAVLKVYDAYDGMRCPEEFAATKHLFDLILWVHRPGHPLDPSMGIVYDPKIMIPLVNYGDVSVLEHQISALPLKQAA